MRRGAWLEDRAGPEAMDPRGWPNVDVSDLDDLTRALFDRRKRAVTMYLSTDRSIASIVEATGIGRSELRRLLTRAFTVAADGRIFGWAALIPRFRIVGYRRKTRSGRGKAGRFGQFLEAHPDIAKQLDDWALARAPARGNVVRGRFYGAIWTAFEKLCRERDVDTQTEYPFTSKDRGREAVRRYCHRLRKQHFVAGARAAYGTGAGRLAASAKGNFTKERGPIPPYRYVQLDGHRLNTELVVVLRDADGTERELPLSRLWLLILIDCASRAILGYHISFRENYAAEDVQQCIAKSLVPWQPMELPSPRLSYPPGGGLPSGVIDQCAWRAFDVLRFDNAYAHLSSWVQKQIIQTGALEVITNRPFRPRSDAIVERFMRTFESTTLHNWPSTTGSCPTDPRRHKSEDYAKWLRIDENDITLAADLAIAHYSVAPHGGLNGMSPLEYLRYRLDRGLDLIRHVPIRDPLRLPLFLKSFTAKVRGGQESGHLPYIQFMGVRYSSEPLAQSPELIGEKVKVIANILDIRRLEVFWKGQSIGHLEADARWMVRRHSVQTRRAIMKLTKEGRLLKTLENPIYAFTEYLRERARHSRRDRNRLLAAQRDTDTPQSVDKDPQSSSKSQQPTRGRIQITKTYITR